MPRSKRKRLDEEAIGRLGKTTLNVPSPVISQTKIQNARENLEPMGEDNKPSSPTNQIVNLQCLQEAFMSAATCKHCRSGDLVLSERSRKGWGCTLNLTCTNCAANTTFNTSPTVENGKSRKINRALVLGMRSIGKGHAAAEQLSAYLDLPPPITRPAWSSHTDEILEKVQTISEEHRLKAARRLKRTLIISNKVPGSCPEDALKTDSYIDDLTVDVAVSFDGTWKNRGHSSHHCIVACISKDTGEILDSEYLCNLCRSIDLNLQYTTFIGDGDNKAFLTAKRSHPYGAHVNIRKEECIGHIKKRMGTRLRRLLNKMSDRKLSDGKGLGGAGRLTLARVESFQYFYGQALTANKGNPEAAHKEILAALNHYARDGDHNDCPERWCSRKSNSGSTIKDPLSPAVVEVLEPIFQELAAMELLEHCSECVTQNVNESFHSTLWRMAPKECFNSPKEVMLALEMAKLYFNEGRFSVNMILFPLLGLEHSACAMESFDLMDFNRIQNSVRKCSDAAKLRRAQIHHSNRKIGFKHDNTSYLSGAYHSGSQVTEVRAPRMCRTCRKPMKGHPKSTCD